uniref:Putative glycoside hydrolase family protein n=1 Tax=viral metagenome TaxID=1070528 RepID=A0A6M3JBD9_9ZZZZ
MGFYEVSFPLVPNRTTSAGPGFDTNVVTMDSKQERRIRRWSQTQHRFDAALQVRTHNDVYTLRAFYLRVGGVANGFRYLDLSDYASTAVGRESTRWADEPGLSAVRDTDQAIGVGDGSGTQFQLVKTYGAAAPTYVRTIKKPISGTVVVALDGVGQSSGWTVDTTTGVVTFTTPPALPKVVSAGYQFEVPVRFSEEIDQWLPTSIDDYGNSSIRSVPLVELVDENPVSEHFFYGGAYVVAPSADVTMSMGLGRFWVVDPQAGGLFLILPPKLAMFAGGQIFEVYNESATNTIALKDSDDLSTVATVATTGWRHVWLGYTSAGALKWYTYA